MTIEELNNLSTEKAFEELFKCCGCTVWAQNIVDFRPFNSKSDLLKVSDMAWISCDMTEGLEAFSHHPKIGDLKSLEKKFSTTKVWAADEQAGVDVATDKTLIDLDISNKLYEDKFGFIFIVCAKGKTATEMLALLKARLMNDLEVEFKIAMKEQNKITHIRLDKLIQ